MAVFMADCDLFQVEISRNYGPNEWRDDLKRVIKLPFTTDADHWSFISLDLVGFVIYFLERSKVTTTIIMMICGFNHLTIININLLS